MKTIFATAIITLILSAAGCITGKPVNVNTTAAANAVSAEPTGTPMAGVGKVDIPAPETVIQALYKAHDAQKSPFFQSKDRALVDKFFSKPLADLIWKDATTHTSDVGAIDGDPLYDGQDLEIKDLKIGKGDIDGKKATVTVSFTNFGEPKSIKFEMSAGPESWKIDNIVYGQSGSLMGWLKETYASKPDTAESGFAGKYQVGTTSCTVKKVGANYEVRWAKGSGVEIFKPTLDALAFNADTKDGGVNSFSFDDETFSSGTFYRADGKSFSVTRAK
ncbi:MAG: hypothetical protein UZ17_ACD001002671 [Acidobacteria bacterium OLB17]|nr:MAG: hypothetical protein UZ17_ACD001002671 [Acidobacteria bacterium OLB17]MCZ2390892.1 YbjP/YqhG family protein [Acidobacteriota bacterium]